MEKSVISKEQKLVLQEAIRWHLDGMKINGAKLAVALHMTQSNISKHLRTLVLNGYIRRPKPHSFIPVRYPDGREIEVVVTKVPTMAAKGYKPLTAKLGEIGRVK